MRNLDHHAASRQQVSAPIDFLIVDTTTSWSDAKVIWCPVCAKRTKRTAKQPLDVIAAKHAASHGAPSWTVTPGTAPVMERDEASRHVKARVKARDGYSCVWCGSRKQPCVDHIVPLSRGGSNDMGNLRVLCWDCNTAKADKLDSEVL